MCVGAAIRHSCMDADTPYDGVFCADERARYSASNVVFRIAFVLLLHRFVSAGAQQGYKQYELRAKHPPFPFIRLHPSSSAYLQTLSTATNIERLLTLCIFTVQASSASSAILSAPHSILCCARPPLTSRNYIPLPPPSVDS